jgi:hypothetical protein
MPQTWVKGTHVVVLQVHFDEGFPVVVALVQFDVVGHETVKAEVSLATHTRQVGGHIAAVVLKQQAIPLLQGVVVQVQAGVNRKVRCTEQGASRQIASGAIGAVGPAVNRANHLA